MPLAGESVVRSTSPPSAPAAPSGVVVEPPAEQPRRAPRALVLDDSPTVRELHRLLLEDVGYVVETCEDSDQALGLAAAEHFSVIVAGVQNRGLDGFALTLALRANPAYREVPIVLTSADADPAMARRASEVGAQRLVRKGGLGDSRLGEALAEIGAVA
jgi:two-component system chemotaxis sensor kinase CheA